MTGWIDMLVIDDEPVLLGAIRKICTPEGLLVDEASTAEQGLAKLAENRYRLVLSDLMLPGVGGIGVLDAAQREHPGMPVVIITGFATLDRAVECFSHGAFDVIPKPFDVAELLAAVRRALDFSELDESKRHEVNLEEFAGERRFTDGGPTGLFALGQHAWVSLEPNGSTRIGVGESFGSIERGLEAVRLPAVADETLQGNECARFTTTDGLVHRVWAPLSGNDLEPLAGRDRAERSGERTAKTHP
jgi:CheY-like chemotaxis protein